MKISIILFTLITKVCFISCGLVWSYFLQWYQVSYMSISEPTSTYSTWKKECQFTWSSGNSYSLPIYWSNLFWIIVIESQAEKSEFVINLRWHLDITMMSFGLISLQYFHCNCYLWDTTHIKSIWSKYSE